MLRPPSIVNFERCYLGALVVGAANLALNWRTTLGAPAVQQAQGTIGSWFLPVVIAASYIVPLLLWYFTARRGSVVAKWIIVVFFGFGVLGLLSTIATGTIARGLSGVLAIVSTVLNGVAVWLLFRPDAAAWFGEAPDLKETFE